MHLFHTPQSSIQNRNVHISVLNGGLWDMEQVHSGICEWGQLVGKGIPYRVWRYEIYIYMGGRGGACSLVAFCIYAVMALRAIQ